MFGAVHRRQQVYIWYSVHVQPVAITTHQRISEHIVAKVIVTRLEVLVISLWIWSCASHQAILSAGSVAMLFELQPTVGALRSSWEDPACAELAHSQRKELVAQRLPSGSPWAVGKV